MRESMRMSVSLGSPEADSRRSVALGADVGGSMAGEEGKDAVVGAGEGEYSSRSSTALKRLASMRSGDVELAEIYEKPLKQPEYQM